jgi:hypothetical protein
LRGMMSALEEHVADTLVAGGMAVRKGSFLALTSLGREAADARARLAEGSDEEAVARRAYESFVPLNRELLQVTTDWQVRPGNVPNDHHDKAYDWCVIDRLKALDERAVPIVRRLARAVERFGGYRDRLRDALTRVEADEPDWFASPRCDSYHTVWMQLHEDLLLALGLPRAEET